MLPADTSHRPPDRKALNRNEDGRRDAGLDMKSTAIMRRLCDVSEQTHDVVGDRRDRQAFDGLLKAQLQLGPVVHRSQQIAVLAFKFDVDPRTQQRDGSGQFVGELGLALLYGLARPHGWSDATLQEVRPGAVSGYGHF